MHVTLEVTSGPAEGECVQINGGQTLTVGRSTQAGLSLPSDDEMSSLHFELTYSDAGCHLRDLNSTNGTRISGEKITDVEVSDGDEVSAGQSVFVVSIATEQSAVRDVSQTAVAGGAAAADATESGPAPVKTDDDGFVPVGSKKLCEDLDLDEDAESLLSDDQSPREYLETLAASELFTAAIRFLSRALPKRQSVWWSCHCVRSVLGEQISDDDAAALHAAEKWVIDPSEENRRAAEEIAVASGIDAVSSLPAFGAFWSGGSLAPPDSQVVPPADVLTSRAAGAAVALAAVLDDPSKAAERRRSFFKQGLAVAAAETPWEQRS